MLSLASEGDKLVKIVFWSNSLYCLRFSSAHVGASCVLLANLLMKQGVCVCVCIHVCIYVYMYVCMHACMYVCMYVCMYDNIIYVMCCVYTHVSMYKYFTPPATTPLCIDYPWPASMLETTGFALQDLRKCCLMIYNRW